MAAGRGRILLIMLVAVVALALGETAARQGDEADRPRAAEVDRPGDLAVARNGWIAAGLVLLARPPRCSTCWPSRAPT